MRYDSGHSILYFVSENIPSPSPAATATATAMDYLTVDTERTANRREKGHGRRATFDSCTAFPDYAELFDDETKELLQNDDSVGVRQNGGAAAAALPLRHHPPSSGQLEHWQRSRRRTLDELDSRGVLKSAEVLRFGPQSPRRGAPPTTRWLEEAELEQLELSRHDLYFVHCHQTVPRSQEAAFKQLVRESAANGVSNVLPRRSPLGIARYDDDGDSPPAIEPSPAPPPPRSVSGDGVFSFHPAVISRKSNRRLIGAGTGGVGGGVGGGDAVNVPSARQIHFECIPQHIDGGLLSAGIFVAYKQWTEASIARHTEAAGECLDQMKKESNVLAAIQRGNGLNSLYGGGGCGGGAFLDSAASASPPGDGALDPQLARQRASHLLKLSQIDDNLADIGDKIRRMVRVQCHISFIEQQYDSHLDPLRSDQLSLSSLRSELVEMRRRSAALLAALREFECWTISNIANTIAERCERIDALNRRIQRCDDERQRSEWRRAVTAMTEWIASLHSVIQRLQETSDRKQREIEALSTSIRSLSRDLRAVAESAHSARCQIVERLLELQNHYALPAVMESTDDIEGQCRSITSSLSQMLSRTDTVDYFERALSLHHSAQMLSERATKHFHRRFVLLLYGVVLDAVVISQWMESNRRRNDHRPAATAQELLRRVLAADDGQFEAVHFLQGIEMAQATPPLSLLQRIETLAAFARAVSSKETAFLDIALAVCIKHRRHIQSLGGGPADRERIEQFAKIEVALLVAHVLSTRRHPNGLLRRIKRLQRRWRRRRRRGSARPPRSGGAAAAKTANVHSVAALILHDVYAIDVPFPM